MAPVKECGEYKIDEHSQRMLLELSRGEATTGELVAPGGFGEGEYQKVKYRMDEHLIPAGLVEEVPYSGRYEHNSTPRQFALTRAGREWLREQDELGFPATVEAAVEDAGEALEAAESAKSSVQNYRKKLNRINKRTKALKKRVDEIETVHKGLFGEDWVVDQHSEAIQDIEGELDELSREDDDKIESIEGDLNALKGDIEDRVNPALSELEALSEHWNDAHRDMESAKERVEALEAENEQLRARVEEIEQEMEGDKSLLSRILPF
jgi:archaellum component FlaC